MFGLDPCLVIGREAACGDQHMDVRVKQHGARPGVKDGQNTEAPARTSISRTTEILSDASGSAYRVSPL